MSDKRGYAPSCRRDVVFPDKNPNLRVVTLLDLKNKRYSKTVD